MNLHSLSRRQFLGAAAGAAATALMPDLAFGQTNPYYRPIKYYVHNNFNRTQLAIIGQAMNHVASRMLDPRMFQWTRGVYGYRYWYFQPRAGGIVPRTTPEFEAVAWTQLQALLAAGFPGVMQIRGAYDAQGDWTGHAAVQTVIAEKRLGARGAYAHVEGNFDVTLNTAILGTTRFSTAASPDYWAGAIAHEMLHNLGHQHPVSVYEGTYIRGYEKAVWYDANPRLR